MINLWYKSGSVDKVKRISPEKTIIFDTETTGLDEEKDEILQISIIDGNGIQLFSSYIKPERRKRWPNAAAVNGITPAMVKDSPLFSDVRPQIQAIFDQAELVVGYNVGFDLKFIIADRIRLRRGTLIFDVMLEYAPVNGVWNDYYNNYKWAKLTTCARHYKVKFDPHDALADAEATRQCFYKMLADEEGYLKIVNPKQAKKKDPNSESTLKKLFSGIFGK